MNIRIFTDLRFTASATPTGVGKHIVHMAHGLSAASGIRLSLLATRDQTIPSGDLPPENALAFLPVYRMPLPWKTASAIWTLTSHPIADRWCGDADWLYCPKNDWIPLNRVKYAVTIHGAHELDPAFGRPAGLKARAYCARNRIQYCKMCKRADVILTVSEWLKSFVVEQFHADSKKIVVVGNGVDPVFYKVAGASPLRGATEDGRATLPYVLCLGGLNHIDGGDRILAFAETIRRAGKPWRIKVVGNQHDAGMEELAVRTGVIDLAGYVPHANLAPLMAGALAFYYPTRYETFGMGAAEAMAAGAPVVTSRCTAVPEIVGDCGVYVNPDKPDEAVEAIDMLANNSIKREELVRRAQERAQRFTWDACVGRLKTVFV